MNNSTEIIEQLSKILGKSSSEIVDHYTRWFIFSGISWIIIGTLCILSIILVPKTIEGCSGSSKLVKWALVIVGILIIGANVADVFVPTAVAIDHLISSITGH